MKTLNKIIMLLTAGLSLAIMGIALLVDMAKNNGTVKEGIGVLLGAACMILIFLLIWSILNLTKGMNTVPSIIGSSLIIVSLFFDFTYYHSMLGVTVTCFIFMVAHLGFAIYELLERRNA